VIDIRNCPLAFECARQWQQLAPVAGQPTVRYCQDCGTSVHLCRSDAACRQHLLKGHCVALELEDGYRVGGTSSEVEYLPP
jgi:hypothetical protein